MTSALASKIRPTIVWEYRDALDLSTVTDDESRRLVTDLANGTGENQANIMWHDRRLVTAATPDDVLNLDLAGGLTDVFGTTLSFVKIKAMLFINRGIPNGSGGWTTALGADLLIGGASANQFDTFVNASGTAKIVVPSGGALLMSAPVDGWAVTAGTGDILLASHSSLRGPQLIVNGDFATGDLTGWTDVSIGDGSSAVVGNLLELTAGAAGLGKVFQDLSLEDMPEGDYVMEFTVSGADSCRVFFETSGIPPNASDAVYAAGTHSVEFSIGALAGSIRRLWLENEGLNEVTEVDNISLREQALGDIEYDIVLIGTDA